MTNEKLNKNNTPLCVTYDIESELIYTQKLNLKIFNSLNGFSSISIKNDLYLCGSNIDKSSYSAGSNLFVFDTLTNKLSYLINSMHNHIHPTLINYSQTIIIVIGGEGSVKCESYDLISKKWKLLPSLPEEKYGCSAYIDPHSEYLYIFGGISTSLNSSALDVTLESKLSNNSYKEIKDDSQLSLYRLNLINPIKWEKVTLNNQPSNRSFSAVISNDSLIYIIGGTTNNGELLKEILEIDIEENSCIVKNHIHKEMQFSNCRQTISFGRGQYYMVNDINSSIKFDINSFKSVETSLLN